MGDITPRVYLLGYANDPLQKTLDMVIEERRKLWDDGVNRRNILLIDIRKSRYTKIKTWETEALEKKYGWRYRYGPNLGNINYKQEDRWKGIELVNEQRGLKGLLTILQKHDVMLICGCSRETTHPERGKACHRYYIAKKIQEASQPDLMVIDL